MAHMKRSRPDSGLGFQLKVLETFQAVTSLLGSGGGGAFLEGTAHCLWGE